MNFMRSMVKEIEALTDSAVHVTRQSVEGVAQAGKDTVEGISQLANSALDEATAALETVSNMGEATLSLISNTMPPSKRRFHPLKPNIMRCACIGDSGVGKSTLLATWREGRYPAGLALPSTIYDWLYFNYCLSSKSLLLEHLQQHRERKANDDDNDNDDELLMKQKEMEMEIAGDVEKENMKEVRKEAEEVVTTVETVKERREIVIEFLDTAGEYEGFRHLRPWHYKDVDVFILAFDLTNRASFANIARYWTEEIKTWGTSCVKILVGTKADIADLASNDDDDNEDGLHRSERGQLSLFGDDGGETVVAGTEANRRRTRRKVEREEAEELAKRIEAVTYVEISSVTQLNLACLLDLCVAQVFEDGNDNEDQEASDKPSMMAETTVTTELTTTTSEGL